MKPALALVLAALLGAAPAPRTTVWLIGDSTMADKPTPERNPERGWGQLLPRFVDATVTVRNRAVNGRSTRSFIAEGRWDAVRDSLRAGDYVLIEFGHNDEKTEDSTRYTNPYTAYRRNLTRFVAEARAKRAMPVLLTPIVRRSFNEKGTLVDTHGAYPLVVRDVARDMAVPFVDLQMLTEDLVRSAGVEGSKALYVWVAPGINAMYPEGRQDDTHLSVAGATEVARLVAAALKAMPIPLAKHLTERAGNGG
jgi:lysophospholipase L1-like esterase